MNRGPEHMELPGPDAGIAGRLLRRDRHTDTIPGTGEPGTTTETFHMVSQSGIWTGHTPSRGMSKSSILSTLLSPGISSDDFDYRCIDGNSYVCIQEDAGCREACILSRVYSAVGTSQAIHMTCTPSSYRTINTHGMVIRRLPIVRW